MLVKISKRFRFDAGHRLILHLGACHNLHGHTYKGMITVEGEVNPETGMVLDFKELKKALVPLIDLFDHSFIANQNDFEVVNLCIQKNWKLVTLDEEPTAENISNYMLSFLVNSLGSDENIKSIEIELWETPDSKAQVKAQLR